MRDVLSQDELHWQRLGSREHSLAERDGSRVEVSSTCRTHETSIVSSARRAKVTPHLCEHDGRRGASAHVGVSPEHTRTVATRSHIEVIVPQGVGGDRLRHAGGRVVRVVGGHAEDGRSALGARLG